MRCWPATPVPGAHLPRFHGRNRRDPEMGPAYKGISITAEVTRTI